MELSVAKKNTGYLQSLKKIYLGKEETSISLIDIMKALRQITNNKLMPLRWRYNVTEILY